MRFDWRRSHAMNQPTSEFDEFASSDEFPSADLEHLAAQLHAIVRTLEARETTSRA